jgi:hypothetical protein
MKKTITLSALLVLAMITVCNAKTIAVRDTVPKQQVAQDSLAEYTGQYQKINNGETFFIAIQLKDGILTGTSLWDGKKFPLKQVSGDKFIAVGVDWPVEFLRDKKKKVNQVLVRNEDYWNKVKN